MLYRFRNVLRTRRADVAMSLITVVWAVHYIVVKDAITHLPPLAFNAIRFSLGLPVLLTAALRSPASLRLARADVPRLLALGLIGPLGYQFFFAMAIDRTTSTNTALLTSTAPMWTALFSLTLGILVIRRPMLIGLSMSVIGVGLVVIGGAESGPALSTTDLLGSTLALSGALCTALYNISIKPLVDRYGSTTVALWVYVITTLGLSVIAAPDLMALTADNLPPRVWPNLLYSGVLSSACGFLVESYAIRSLGPTRMSSYSNFTPVIAAVAGILVMGDSLTVSLLIGGGLALLGVVLVRKNTYLRLPPTLPAPHPAAPAPEIASAQGQ